MKISSKALAWVYAPTYENFQCVVQVDDISRMVREVKLNTWGKHASPQVTQPLGIVSMINYEARGSTPYLLSFLLDKIISVQFS